MLRLIAAIAMLTVALPATAHAWWDYAKWGMTAAQLSKASNGRLQECAGNCPGAFTGFNPTHWIDVDVAGFPGRAMFAFDAAGRLNWTVLRIQSSGSFNPLERALLGVYGAPADRSPGSVPAVTWRDPVKKSSIRLVGIGASYIEYKPAAAGL